MKTLKIFRNNLLYIINLLLVITFSINFVYSENKLTYDSITIVSDDNYPPYIFRDENNHLQGIIIDQWKLWEAKTNIKVNIIAMNWINAQSFFNQENADVIETAFLTPQRDEYWDFTKPYAEIEVPVFFNTSLSGITNIESLHGFTIGVKSGDACIEIFKKHKINSLKEYNSYQELINAAEKGEIKVFCVDKPPALYYLYKKNLEDKFKLAFTLYTGKFHRAVKENNKELLDIIENGFKKISENEIEDINEKWLGKPILNQKVKKQITIAALILISTTIILLIFNILLRYRIKVKTKELEQAFGEISKNEKKFRTIFNSINDTILIHSLYNGKIIESYLPAEKLYGYSSEELKQIKIHDISLGETPYTQKEAMDYIIKTTKEGPQVFEWIAKQKNGELIWVEVSMSYNPDFYKDAIIVVVRDISERKKAENEIKELNATLEKKVEERTQQLKEANKELESFAYTVSHDLRAPLRAIDGFTKILIEDHSKDLSEDGIKVSNTIIRNTKKMGQLIDDLLAFSRVSRNEVVKMPVDMNFIIDTVCKELINDENKNKITIETSDLPKCTGDRALIKQVWTNLISNAIKFSSKKEKSIIKISFQETDTEVIYSISDNGCGFDNKYADKLFGVFQRLHSNQDYEGTGVGLAIVQRIIAKHGGKIWAKANINEGAEFYFNLKKISVK